LIKGVEDIIEIENTKNIEDSELGFRCEEHSKQIFKIFLQEFESSLHFS
jgi:hypothetical protein